MKLKRAKAIPRFKDKILLQMNKKGNYKFFGGRINKNETPEQAVNREFYEETGISISRTKKIIKKKGDTVFFLFHLRKFLKPKIDNKETFGYLWVDKDKIKISLKKYKKELL